MQTGGLLQGVTDYVCGSRYKETSVLLLPRVLWLSWEAPLGGAQLVTALVRGNPYSAASSIREVSSRQWQVGNARVSSYQTQ